MPPSIGQSSSGNPTDRVTRSRQKEMHLASSEITTASSFLAPTTTSSRETYYSKTSISTEMDSSSKSHIGAPSSPSLSVELDSPSYQTAPPFLSASSASPALPPLICASTPSQQTDIQDTFSQSSSPLSSPPLSSPVLDLPPPLSPHTPTLTQSLLHTRVVKLHVAPDALKRFVEKGTKIENEDDEDFVPAMSPPVSAKQPRAKMDVAKMTGPRASRKRKAKEEESDSKSDPKPKKQRAAGKAKPVQKPSADDAQAGKPDPVGMPEIWSDKRQPLCNTLRWFHGAHQSASYANNGMGYGFMCDAQVGIRDKFDTEIVISRIGGGRDENEQGELIQMKEQGIDKGVPLAFLNAKLRGQPIGFISGKRNTGSPTKMPHAYNVCGWFHVTDVWVEMIDGCKTAKMRLEKIDLSTPSWWASKDSPAPTASTIGLPRCQEIQCGNCQRISKLMYNQGWTCLNSDCDKYFYAEQLKDLTSEDRQAFDTSLDYSQDFLAERTPFQGSPVGPLAPPLLTNEDIRNKNLSGTEEIFTTGIVCAKCGCCTRRREWVRWTCENADCTWVFEPEMRKISAKEVIEESFSNNERQAMAKVYRNPMIKRLEPKLIGGHAAYEYRFPGENGEDIGAVYIFKSNGLINQQVNGPNDLFEQLQDKSLELNRNPARCRGSIIETLTAHFGKNWGAPYKYGVDQDSKPFAKAPPPVWNIVDRLSWAAKKVGGFHHEFNECLTLGYFDGSHISYHDDGESTLGPTVASISLGCRSIMSWRPKGNRGVMEPGWVPRGKKGNKPDILKIPLDHGDIMIMDGYGIQQLYDHKVDPCGKLRFGVTCRYIRPEMVAEEDRDFAKGAGILPPEAGQFKYDGDANAVPVNREPVATDNLTKFAASLNANIITGDVLKEQASSYLKAVLPNLFEA